SEDSLHGHICHKVRASTALRKQSSLPICLIATTASSNIAGIRRVPGPTPIVESAPSRSTSVSKGTPKTPKKKEKKKKISWEYSVRKIHSIPFFLAPFFASPFRVFPNLPQKFDFRASMRPSNSSKLK